MGKTFTFSEALELMKDGFKIMREGWNGKGIFVGGKFPDERNSGMTSSFAYIDTTGVHTKNKDAPKNRVPWIPSQTDMFAEDWVIFEVA